MPTLVHLADARDARRIERVGIVPGPRGVVYFMPVLPNHLVTHQWARELRRSGARSLVGVYFRLPAETEVWAGHYNGEHLRIPLGEAIRLLNGLTDQLGQEMFLERKVSAREVTAIRPVPPGIGWRYQPHAHGKAPCPCPVCLPRGAMHSREIRERLDPRPEPQTFAAARQVIMSTRDPELLSEPLWSLRRRRPRADPEFLRALLDIDDELLQLDLVRAIDSFRHPNAVRLLRLLSEHPETTVGEAALRALERRARHGG